MGNAESGMADLRKLVAERKFPDGKWKALADPELAYAAARAAAENESRFAELEKQAERVERALTHAYAGSAEHGSFLRKGGGEYVPSVFLILEEFKRALHAMKG